MSSTTADFRPRTRGNVLRSELDGELALFDPATNELLLLNASARIVWLCCDGSGSVAEIAHDIADAFGVDEDVVHAQVDELVRAWSARGLLEGAPGVHVGTP